MRPKKNDRRSVNRLFSSGKDQGGEGCQFLCIWDWHPWFGLNDQQDGYFLTGRELAILTARMAGIGRGLLPYFFTAATAFFIPSVVKVSSAKVG